MRRESHVSLDSREQKHFKRGFDENAHICCVFSTLSTHTLSRGTTLRGSEKKHFWLIRQVDGASYGVRGVDGDFLPFGAEAVISESELLAHYTPEAAVLESRLLMSAQNSVFRVDEANVRGLFALSLKYVHARKLSRARHLIRELLRLESEYPGKNQFLFNSFGIGLRKVGYFEGAVLCYRRALAYTLEDDHLYYNLARAHYEYGQWWDCMNTLVACFKLNPELPVARDLVLLTIALANNSALRRRYGKPPVPDGVARRAGLLGEAVFTHDAAAREIAEGRSLNREELRNSEIWLPGRDAVGL